MGLFIAIVYILLSVFDGWLATDYFKAGNNKTAAYYGFLSIVWAALGVYFYLVYGRV